MFDAKWFIGQRLADPIVQFDVQSRPFEVVSGSGDKPMIHGDGLRRSLQPVGTGQMRRTCPECVRTDRTTFSPHRTPRPRLWVWSSSEAKNLPLPDHGMPGLMACRSEFGTVQPFKGLNIKILDTVVDAGKNAEVAEQAVLRATTCLRAATIKEFDVIVRLEKPNHRRVQRCSPIPERENPLAHWHDMRHLSRRTNPSQRQYSRSPDQFSEVLLKSRDTGSGDTLTVSVLDLSVDGRDAVDNIGSVNRSYRWLKCLSVTSTDLSYETYGPYVACSPDVEWSFCANADWKCTDLKQTRTCGSLLLRVAQAPVVSHAAPSPVKHGAPMAYEAAPTMTATGVDLNRDDIPHVRQQPKWDMEDQRRKLLNDDSSP